MPPKVAQKGVPAGTDETKTTKEDYERELRELEAKASQQTTFRYVMMQIAQLFQAVQILAIAAVYSNVSQLNLSPVYGAIPSGLWHSRLVITGCVVGWSSNLWLEAVLPRKPIYYLAPVALSIPMVQHFLFKLSSYLGPVFGPIITELFTFVPFLVLSASSAAHLLDNLDLSFLPEYVANSVPGVGAFCAFRAIEQLSKPILRNNMGSNFLTTRIGLQLVASGICARLAPSLMILGGSPGLFHTLFLNPHTSTPFAQFDLNLKLAKATDFKILARQDSVTGYLSVLENRKEQYRVLRCDHSLLGGVWLPRGEITINEPIYGVFAMLEAVRLIEVPGSTSRSDENALVM